MTVCPMCEHQQVSGFECDVCGKDLSGPLADLGPPPVAVEKVAGLEATIPERVGDIAIDRVAEVEANAFAKAPDAPTSVTQDLETSALPRVGEVTVERIADLAEDRAAPDNAPRTAAPSGQVVCRYCKNVQAAGSLCERCGMKLPTALRTDAAAPNAEWVRCRACGAPGPLNERCRECGRLVTAADP